MDQVILNGLSGFYFCLGFGTALIGQKGAMACTIAVEELIGNHYNKQMTLLLELDPKDNAELLKVCLTPFSFNNQGFQLIRKMRDDEMHHHDLGVEYDGLNAPMYQVLKAVIQAGCKAAIFTAERV